MSSIRAFGVRRRRPLLIAGAAAVIVALVPATAAFASTPLTTLVSGTGYGKMVTLGTNTYTFSNFNQNKAGIDLSGKAGLTGVSPSSTVLKMNSYSSTKASSVPTASGTANPYFLVRAGGANVRLSNFSLVGTSQGHLYNGLLISSASSPRVSNVSVSAIPGAGYVPPQETFSVTDLRTSNGIYSNLKVDGSGIGASGFGSNYSSNVTISNSTFQNLKYSAGVALWTTSTATLTNVVSKYNRTGLNFEECSGTITVTNPTILGATNQDVYVGSTHGSTKIVITNPTYSGHLRIRVPAIYHGQTNRQLKSDIKVLVNGVDRTSSIVTWL